MSHGAPNKIIEVVTYRGWGGYFFEDLEFIRKQGTPVADRYHTKTGHERFPFVRTPAPVVGVGLKLDHGSVHWGDAVAVSFGGKSGRAGPGSADQLEKWFQDRLAPWIKGRTVTSWLETEQAFIKEFPDAPPFVRYAVSQAIISAVSTFHGEQSFKVMAKELKLPIVKSPVPLHGSSGADWNQAVDRMLARRLTFLPQGQFESILDQIGTKGEKLLAWVREFKKRAEKFSYVPTLTLDFHGALGELFKDDMSAVADLIKAIASEVKPHKLHLESPIVGKTLKDHAEQMAEIRKHLSSAGDIRLVADEWANEVADIQYLIDQKAVDGIHIKMPDTGSLSECAEAVSICRKAGVFALLGGSCTETDIGARLSAQLAMATRPDALLVKPGMGFDESYALMFNEMARISL